MLRSLRFPVFGFSDFIALLCGLSLVSVQMSHILNDPGVGWHLADGKWIVTNFKIPFIDPFLHSLTPREWISDQWLSDVILYLVFKTGEWQLLYGAFFALFMIVFPYIVFKTAHVRSKSFIGAALAALIAFKITEIHFIIRPVVFSFLFFSLCYKELSREKFKSSSYIKLPILFLLWANLHPSFVLGLSLLAVYVASKFIEKRSLTDVAPLILLLSLTSLVTLINPYGFELHRSIISLGQSSFFMSHHSEWLPPSIEKYETLLFGFSSLLFILSPIILKRNIYSVFEFLSFVLFFYLGTKAVRMLPYFGIVVAAPIAASMTYLAKYLHAHSSGTIYRVSELIRKIEIREVNTFQGTGFIKILIFVVLGSSLFGRIPLYHGEFGPPASKFPVGAVSYLLKNLDENKKIIILSPPSWGGYLIWFGEEKLIPVIDDRNTLLGENFVKKFYESMRPQSDWQAYARELGANLILLPKNEPLVEYAIQNGSKVLYSDDLSTLLRIM